MVKKAKRGTKRVCQSCETKYYDLERDPIICPNCGTRFEVARSKPVPPPPPPPRRPPPAPAPAPVKPAASEPAADEPETISLDEADDDAKETGSVEADLKAEGADADLADDDDDDDNETFLATDDDDDDDVGDIIGDVKKDET